MLKRRNLYLNELLILEWLFEFGYEQKRGRKIIGCGLNISDFKKYSKSDNKLSREIFYNCANHLLNSKLIIEIKTKNERIKFYSITPLGLIHLFNNSHSYDLTISASQLQKFELILNCFITNNNTKTTIFQFNKSILRDSFLLIRYLVDASARILPLLSSIARYDDDFNRIDLYVDLGNVCSFNTTTLILQGGIYVIHEHKTKSVENYHDELEDNEFHSYLAHFFVYAVTYRTVCLDHELFLKKHKSYLDQIKSSKSISNKIKSFNLILDRIIQFNNYFIKQANELDKNLINLNERLDPSLKMKAIG